MQDTWQEIIKMTNLVIFVFEFWKEQKYTKMLNGLKILVMFKNCVNDNNLTTNNNNIITTTANNDNNDNATFQVSSQFIAHHETLITCNVYAEFLQYHTTSTSATSSDQSTKMPDYLFLSDSRSS